MIRNVLTRKTYMILGMLAASAAAPFQAMAGPAAGDIVGDGLVNEQDLAALTSHLLGSAPLSGGGLTAADVNADSIIDAADLVGLGALISPPAKLVSSSPASGEDHVAVTRETILTFSAAIDPATVNASSIRAEFGAASLTARYEISPDQKTVTLFYDPPLPPSARVRVTVKGDLLKDAAGRLVDADGNALAGGTAKIDFDTLILTRVAGTRVAGRVFASEMSALGGPAVNTPLEGVRVSVAGADGTIFAITDALGDFRLQDTPAGTFFVHIDGRTVTSALVDGKPTATQYPDGYYYPIVSKAWTSVAGTEINIGEIYLPLIIPGTLRPTSPTQDTFVDFPPGVLQRNPEFAGVSVTVPANSLFGDNGARGGQVGIAPVPPDRIPGPLPAGLEFPVVITVQTDGASNFGVPVPASFPNLPDPATGQPLAPGEKNFLYSFDHDKGEWVGIGPMTVTADGKLIKTDPGVGIVAPGWHGSGPTPVQPPPSPTSAQNTPPPTPTPPGSTPAPTPTATPCDDSGRFQCLAIADARATACTIANDDAWANVQSSCLATASTPEEEGQCLAIGQIEYIFAQGACEAQAVAETDGCLTNHPLCAPGAEPGAEPTAKPGSKRKSGLDLGIDWSGAKVQPKTPDPVLDQIRALIAQTSALIAPYAGNPTGIPQSVKDQIDALLAQADVLGNGNASAYLRNAMRGIETQEQAAAKEFREPQGNAPGYPILYAARLERAGKLLTVRGRTGPYGQYQLFTPRNGSVVSISFYDPRAKAWGMIFPRALSSAPYQLRRFYLTPVDATFSDRDADGLADAVELVYGTDVNDPDTDGDGVNDGAEIEQGTNPLDGLPAITGLLTEVGVAGTANDISAVNDTAVVAGKAGGVSVFNVFNGMNPVIIGKADVAGEALAVAISGRLIAAACGSGGLAIIDISDPPNALVLHQTDLGADALSVSADTGVAYVGLANGDVVSVHMASGGVLGRVNLDNHPVHDLSPYGDYLMAVTNNPSYVVSMPLTGGLRTVAGSAYAYQSLGAGQPRLRLFAGGGVAYVTGVSGYSTLNLSNPAAPAFIAQGSTGSFGWRQIVANGSGIGVAITGPNSTEDGPHRVALYDVSSPSQTNAFLTQFAAPDKGRALSIYNGMAYVADGTNGMAVVNYMPYDALKQAPTITLTTVPAGAQIEEGKPLRILANVADDVQVRNVEFYLNGVKVLTDGNFPFELRTIAPTLTQTSTLQAQARASDTGGNATWSAISTFTLTQDISPPTVAGTAPYADANITQGALASVAAYWSEPIDPTTVSPANFVLVSAGPDGAIDTGDDVAVAGGSVSYVADLAASFLQVSSNLGRNRYRATIAPPVKDLAGNTLAGSFSWKFSYGDYTPPAVQSVYPPAGGAAVGQLTEVRAVFGEALDPASVGSGALQLFGAGPNHTPGDGDDVAVPGTVSYDAATRTARLALGAPAAANDSYRAVMNPVSDPSGNVMTPAYAWTFTGDQTAPRVTSTTPSQGALSPSTILTTISARISEPLNPATVTAGSLRLYSLGVDLIAGTGDDHEITGGTVSYDAATQSVVLTLPAAAAIERFQAVLSGSVTDETGNALGADYRWTFGLGPFSDVNMIETTPGGPLEDPGYFTTYSDMDLFTKSFSVKFSESLNPATVNASTVLMVNIGHDYTLGTADDSPVPGGTLSYDDPTQTITISFAQPLPAGVYNFLVDYGVSDIYGNPVESSSGGNQHFKQWNIYLGDLNWPEWIDHYPNQYQTRHPGLDRAVFITFEEAMDPASITPQTLYVLEPGPDNQFFTSDDVRLTSSTIAYDADLYKGVITFPMRLPAGSYRAVALGRQSRPAGAVGEMRDVVGNPLNATVTWDFFGGVAADALPPAVVSVPSYSEPTFPASNSLAGLNPVTAIYASINDELNPSTLSAAGFALTFAGADGALATGDDAPVAGTPAYAGPGRPLKLNLSQALAPGLYRASISGPIADVDGHEIVPYSWTFRVGPIDLVSEAPAWFSPVSQYDIAYLSMTAPVGDVDGDGIDDFLMHSAYDDNTRNINDVGKTYLKLGKATGWIKDEPIMIAAPGFLGEASQDQIRQGDNSNRTIAGVGDVNNDGKNDYVIASAWNDQGGTDAGKIYLVFGRAAAWTGETVVSDAATASFLGEFAGDQAGFSVAGAGDVNGDGFDDFLIGAPYADGGIALDISNTGKVYLILGKASGWTANALLSTADASFVGYNPDGAGGNAGWSLAGGRDLNGDGKSDFVIGELRYDLAGAPVINDVGAAFVVFGKASGWTRDVSLQTADASFIGELSDERAGTSVALAEDVNGDSKPDILIGSPRWANLAAAPPVPYAGRVSVIFGKAAGWASGVSLGAIDVRIEGHAEIFAGNSIAGLGDVNGDGVGDILVGAADADDYVGPGYDYASGQAYLLLGRASWPATFRLDRADHSWLDLGTDNQKDGWVGSHVSDAGDVNNDGFADMLIGAVGTQDSAYYGGAVYLIFGGPQFVRAP